MKIDGKDLQKLVPILLVIIAITFGVYLLMKKGILSFPSNEKKGNVVDLGKSSVVDILFSGGEFKLNYGEKDPSSLLDIAKFDKTEQWQGEGSIEENMINGGMMMSLVDRDGKKASTVLNKNLNLSKVDNIKFSVNVKSDSDDIESLAILFGNREGTTFFRFPVTNLTQGVNNLNISKYRFSLIEGRETEVKKSSNLTKTPQNGLSWEKIEKVQIDLISRPGSKASVDLGWIRAEKEDEFVSDWNWDGNAHFLNLYHVSDSKIALLVQNYGRSMGILKKVGSVKDFEYSAKLVSVKSGPIGLFFRGDYKTGYGYYLSVGGIGTSDWTISKYYIFEKQPSTKVLLKGQIGNFEFVKDQPFWLKVTVKGNNIIGYFSLDGKDYTKLGETTDGEYETGGVGVAAAGGGISLFDEFSLIQK